MIIIIVIMELGIAMSIMENNENLWEQSHPQNQQCNSEQQPQANQCPLRLEELAEAKERLSIFMSQLGEHRRSEIRSDVLAHCEQLNRSRKVVSGHISDDSILRFASSRIEKMLKNKKIKKNWSEEDIKILVWVVSKYCDKQGVQDFQHELGHQDWERIARLIPGVTASSCMFKWLGLRKVNLSSCSWNPSESQLLRDVIEDHQIGGKPAVSFSNFNWKAVAEELYKRSGRGDKVFRSAKQCREHWNCFLNPRLKKGPWLVEQDIQLLSLIKTNNGEKKWSEIVFSFDGRTENALKNRYTLLIEKQRKISKSKQELALIDDCLERCYEQQLQGTGYKQSVMICPMKEEEKEESLDWLELRSSSQAPKSEDHTFTSLDCLLPKASASMKIQYLTSSVQQLQFLQLIRQRSDLKRCCLKNGSFQLAE